MSVSYACASLSRMTAQTPVPSERKGNRLVRIAARRWPHALVLAGVVVVLFFAAFGFSSNWGAQQWGPFSAWLASGLTLTAVSIALWQAFRAERTD
jgi:protein-S-isoprenylcysteine O-methyltransferase Ste14